MENKLKYLEEWRELSGHGNFKLAENLYYEKLFPEVISIFCDKFQSEFSEKRNYYSLFSGIECTLNSSITKIIL